MKTKSFFIMMVILILGISLLSCSKKPSTPSSGFLDSINYENGLVSAWGWAADKDDGAPVEKVMVFVDDKMIGEAKLGLDRQGVADEMKNPNWVKSGWTLSVQMPLEKGKHKAHAISVNKRGEQLRLHHELEFDVK
jgi:hypothetical protein